MKLWTVCMTLEPGKKLGGVESLDRAYPACGVSHWSGPAITWLGDSRIMARMLAEDAIDAIERAQTLAKIALEKQS